MAGFLHHAAGEVVGGLATHRRSDRTSFSLSPDFPRLCQGMHLTVLGLLHQYRQRPRSAHSIGVVAGEARGQVGGAVAPLDVSANRLYGFERFILQSIRKGHVKVTLSRTNRVIILFTSVGNEADRVESA
jgi:hypothetical protein